MKRIIYACILVLIIAIAVIWLIGKESYKAKSEDDGFLGSFKRPIMRVALVADSHNENDYLAKALRQAQGRGINFVIGLGDYTNLGISEELENAKREFEKSSLEYFVTAGDRDGWDSRDKGTNNFVDIFGNPTQIIDREKVLFVLLDNSNLYHGISREDWETLEKVTKVTSETNGSKAKLTFVFTHKTPFHPQSTHIMGEQSEVVGRQAKELMSLLEERKVDGLFSGDLHFFARFNSPLGSVKITTIGAVATERNFQGPRFAVLTVWDDYSWEVEDVEIR